MIQLSTLIPNQENPRIIKDANFKKLVRSVKDFPKMMELRKIIIDEERNVLGGNMRLAVCKEMGMTEIPEEWVHQVLDLTPEEKREFIVKDNLSFGEWDWESLNSNWNLDELAGWALDIPEKPKVKAIVEDDYLMGGTIQTDIVPGDMFEIDRHRLFCADTLVYENVILLMNGSQAQMVFNHPPEDMDESDLHACYTHSADKAISTGLQFWVVSDLQAGHLAACYREFSHFFFQDYRIAPAISSNQARIRHNTIAMFGKRKMNNLKDGFSTVLEIPSTGTTKANKKLPQAKRIDLPAAFIKHYSNEDDIILDLFGHSGSTLMACQQLNRICYTQDIEPKYCYAMLDRYLRAFPNANIKKNGLKYLHK